MKTKTKRMHTEDARFLRDLLLTVIDRQNELEESIGDIQQIIKPELGIEIPEPVCEVVEIG